LNDATDAVLAKSAVFLTIANSEFGYANDANLILQCEIQIQLHLCLGHWPNLRLIQTEKTPELMWFLAQPIRVMRIKSLLADAHDKL
jgi:hypothetical protein